MTAFILISAFVIWTMLVPAATALGGYLLATSKMDSRPNSSGRWYLVGLGIMLVGASISLFNHHVMPQASDGTPYDLAWTFGNLAMAAILTAVYLIRRAETRRRVACRLAQIEAM